MSLCTISITAKTAAGAALAGAVLTFTKAPGDRLTTDAGAAIWPLAVQVTCNAGGLGTVALLPGDYVCQTAGPLGPVRQLITVPDVIATTLDVLIGSTGVTFETITWATYAALVAATRRRGMTGLLNFDSPNTWPGTETAVITMVQSMSAPLARLRRNGVLDAESSTSGGTGTFGTWPIDIGGRGNDTTLFSGRIYGLLAINRALTTQELALAERWAARKCGVTI